MQHARPLLAFVTSALALPPLFAVLTGSDRNGAGYVGVVFGYLGVSAPMFFGQWFIGQEKIKGTFKLLRLLPVSGTRIIFSKYMSSTILCLVLINGILLVEPAVCRLAGLHLSSPSAPLVLWTNITAAFLVAVGIVLFTALDFRIATQAIIWTICGIMTGIGLAGRYLQDGHADVLAGRANLMINDLRLTLGIGLALTGAAPLMVWFAARLFERMEWCQLEEG
jgi:hypothetical protein